MSNPELNEMAEHAKINRWIEQNIYGVDKGATSHRQKLQAVISTFMDYRVHGDMGEDGYVESIEIDFQIDRGKGMYQYFATATIPIDSSDDFNEYDLAEIILGYDSDEEVWQYLNNYIDNLWNNKDRPFCSSMELALKLGVDISKDSVYTVGVMVNKGEVAVMLKNSREDLTYKETVEDVNDVSFAICKLVYQAMS